jgi:hypothetical protein
MRALRTFAAVVAIGLVAAAPTATANGGHDGGGSHRADTLAVWGDAPYGVNQADTSQFVMMPAFISSINADPKVERVIHVGDIHSGKQVCSDAYNRSIFAQWTAFQDPLVFTPGDNEWADCHKTAEGATDPLTNLALVRSTFFPQPGQTLGMQRARVLSQGQFFDPHHPADSNYVENVIWAQSNVLFVTVNIPGGSNNDMDPWFGAPSASPAQQQEVADRTGADLRWLDAAFALARAGHADAVAIVDQADMWDLDGQTAAHLVGYEPFVRSVASHTSAFRRPVLMFNGDSHIYKSDNPLSASDPLNSLHPGYDVRNFHRVVVHGSTLPLEWLRLTIRPGTKGSGASAFGPFSWERIQP